MAAEKSIEQKVKEIIVEQLGVNADQVTPDAKFIEDLGADSLDTVELVMALEEEFGQEIPDEEAEKLQSVGDVIKYIEDSQQKYFAIFSRAARRLSSAALFLFYGDRTQSCGHGSGRGYPAR